MNNDGTWAEDRCNPLYYMVHVAKVALPLYPPVRYRAQRLLHPAALGATRLPAADVWSRRRRRHRAPIVIPIANSWRCCSSSGARTGSSSVTRSRKDPRFTKPRCAGKITTYNDTVIAYGQDGKEIFRTTVEGTSTHPARQTRELDMIGTSSNRSIAALRSNRSNRFGGLSRGTSESLLPASRGG
jgi:hypothetical protein